MKLNEQSAKGAGILIVVIVVVVLAVVLFKDLKKVLDGLFEGVGLKDSKEETENKDKINNEVNEQNGLGFNSAWSPNFYKQKAGAKLITQAKTDSLVNDLWDSVGYIYDTPSKGSAAIKQCQYKTQVSWLADNFQKKYRLDLLNWLENKYDTSEQREYLAGMLRYVEGLKTGF